ncbi:MAG: Clp protease N-terminal domain-containing protein [Thermoguttaceae bacterium]|jgi:hypothetical protein|nr:Clp protease N-terminal domain-containing protein [Thermoguttaceae bacterium]
MSVLSCLYGRRAVRELIELIEQVPARAAVRLPMALDRESVALVLFWTFLRWERTFPLVALEKSGVDMWRLTCDVDELLAARRALDVAVRPESRVRDSLSLVYWPALRTWVNHWLDAAQEESRALGHEHLGLEHLILAIIGRAEGPLADVLLAHGIAYDLLRKLVEQESVRAGAAAPTVPDLGVRRGPPGARWDRPAAGVPRRFGLGTLLLITTMFAVLYASLQLLGAHPVVFVMVVVLFAGVGLGQMLLFGGKYPRAASIWVGLVLFPIEVAVAMLYVASQSLYGGPDPNEVCALAVLAVPFGAGFGYLAGGLTAGVFLLLDKYAERRAKEKPASVEESQDGDPWQSAGPDAPEKPGAASPP